MQITVVGGGNIGTLMAAEFAHKGHKVIIYTPKVDKWEKNIDVLDNNKNYLFSGKLYKITNNLEDAVVGSEIIWITLPAQMFNEFGEQLHKYIKPNQMVGVVPGCGGAEIAFRKVVEKGGVLFGLQRVHSISRLNEYGKSVCMLGRKSKLEVGSIPSECSTKISPMLEKLFDIKCVALPNYLCVTLTPSNPILHTTRLFSLFKDYKQGTLYPKNFLFYEEWSDFASEMLIACDDELQNLCKVIPLDLKDVVSLKEYYENSTVEGMTKKIRSINAFKGLKSPMIEEGEGWVPDFESRYFSTDFPYGLRLIKELGDIFGVKMPNIDRVWNWYVEVSNKDFVKPIFDMTREDIIKLYD